MDPGFPKGGIERVFAQYDRITSHRPPQEHPFKEQNPPDDEPPWWTDGPPITQAEHEQGVLKNNLGHDPQKQTSPP